MRRPTVPPLTNFGGEDQDARPPSPESSGWVVSFLRRATSNTAHRDQHSRCCGQLGSSPHCETVRHDLQPAAARSMSRNSKPLERRLSANLRCCALKRDPRFPNTSTTPGIVNPEPCLQLPWVLVLPPQGEGNVTTSAQEGTGNPAFSTNFFVFF